MNASTATETPAAGGEFVSALRFRMLTRAYDTVVRLTTRERSVTRALLDAAHLESASRLLDVGCGTGTFAIEAKCRYAATRTLTW